ncbi:hypothetical protein GGTG_01983 [Gaeumannomyces tritici R3-111a-1]|uniref:chitin deacetylase n=1 Tax=Gaeumannomyces tritici (strain R3-111a-1) TaxID=644352 RepID=J3NL42_GAET3|nr:hypothetical protein GGTG_01983 [Gaeumannomyces tritici R3-111a-1]EJT82009.1 hypothetical protein GGTG_01983 [Gaeumannomyces tritici R3-111a-1]
MATLVALAALSLLVLLPLYAVYKPPAPLLRHLARHWPDVLWQVDPDRLPRDHHHPEDGRSSSSGPAKVVALTIDDAPSDQTARILDLLRAHGARATFFVIGGQVEGREELLRRIVREGHELGNHAMHDEASRSLRPDELEDQILRVQGMIRAAYADAGVRKSRKPPGSSPGLGPGPYAPRYNYFRPGSGFFTDRMRGLVSRLGYRLVLGSIYPHDAQISHWRLNARHILSMLRPGRIIICHDRRSWTVPMLERVLPEARRRGYQLVNVSELITMADTDT